MIDKRLEKALEAFNRVKHEGHTDLCWGASIMHFAKPDDCKCGCHFERPSIEDNVHEGGKEK